MQSRYTAAAFMALLAFVSAAGARTLLASGPAAAPMMSMGAPAMAPSSASAPAATESEAAPAAAPAQATPSRTPAPAGCALSYIQANSSYSKFAQILYATPYTANLSNILSDQISGITVFLPSNDAINATLEKFGLDFDGLLKNQGLCTQIMEYHILPSPIEYSAFKEGYSFNTILNDQGEDLRDSLRVRRSGDDIKIQSGKTLAKVGTNGAKVCEDSVFPISMLLLPRNSIQASGTPSS